MSEEIQDPEADSSVEPREPVFPRLVRALTRITLVVLLGAAVAGASFYLLRKFGY